MSFCNERNKKARQQVYKKLHENIRFKNKNSLKLESPITKEN